MILESQETLYDLMGDNRVHPINDFLQHMQAGSTIRFVMIEDIKYMNGNILAGAKIQSELFDRGQTILLPEHLPGILDNFLNRTDFEREMFCGPTRNILQIVFDMVHKAMNNYYAGGAYCANQPKDICKALHAAATTLTKVVDHLLTKMDSIGKHNRLYSRMKIMFTGIVGDALDLFSTLMADIDEEYEGHIAVMRHKEAIIRTISKIIEKDFSKNWFISRSGWDTLKRLLKQDFENKFWQLKRSDQEATSLHSSNMIMASIDGNVLGSSKEDHSRFVIR